MSVVGEQRRRVATAASIEHGQQPRIAREERYDEPFVACLGSAPVTQGLKDRRQRGQQPENRYVARSGQLQEPFHAFGICRVHEKDPRVQPALDFGLVVVSTLRMNGRDVGPAVNLSSFAREFDSYRGRGLSRRAQPPSPVIESPAASAAMARACPRPSPE